MEELVPRKTKKTKKKKKTNKEYCSQLMTDYEVIDLLGAVSLVDHVDNRNEFLMFYML